MTTCIALGVAAFMIVQSGCGGRSRGKGSPLPPPSGLTATPGDRTVTLDWGLVPAANSYDLYWSTSTGVTKATGNLLPGVTRPYTHGGLTNGTTYYYIVVSVRGSTESAESSEASATPFVIPTGLDTTFGGRGWVVHGNAGGGGGGDVGLGIAVDSADRIVVGGYSQGASNLDMAIWRFLPDGSLDTAFDGKGWVTHDAAAGGSGDDVAEDIVLDAADGIFAGGHSQKSGLDDLAIWHYDSTGALDPGFGTTGFVTHNDAAGGNWHDRGMGIALDGASGRVYATGQSHNGTGFDMVIWAYDSTGTLDGTFGTGGIVTHDGAAGAMSTESGIKITLDSPGRILVVGHGANPRGNFDMVIWAYDAAGALDGSFGNGGVAVHDEAAALNSRDWGLGIAIGSLDEVVVGGYSEGATWEMVAWRYLPTGILDTTFGSVGFVTHDGAAGGGMDDAGSDVAIDSSSRPVLTGWSENAGLDSDMVIWRYNADGTLDSSFANGGVFVHDDAAGGGGDDAGRAITLDAQGRILVVGSSTNASGDEDMVIWRHWP